MTSICFVTLCVLVNSWNVFLVLLKKLDGHKVRLMNFISLAVLFLIVLVLSLQIRHQLNLETKVLKMLARKSDMNSSVNVKDGLLLKIKKYIHLY